MASIRPNKGGSKVAKRRRRRASARKTTTAPRRRRRRTYRRNIPTVYAANPRRRHRRRTYRRNPPMSLSIKGITNTGINAGKNAIGVLSGKVAARVGRGKIGIAGGTPVGMATELAIGIGGAVVTRRFLGQRFAEMFVTGAVVSVLEPFAKSILPASIGGTLGDEDTALISGGGGIAGYLNGVGTYELPNGGRVGSYDVAEA